MSKEDALALMDHETWLTASDAVEKGLCDEITGSNNTNSVDFAQSLVASVGRTLPQEVINKYQAEKQDLMNEIHALEMMEV
jgi:phage antirepressor YoqD-like protein